MSTEFFNILLGRVTVAGNDEPVYDNSTFYEIKVACETARLFQRIERFWQLKKPRMVIPKFPN